MELSKHRNHRNLKYLAWLRKQACVVSGKIAECAHHIRLGTNGGSSLKPSDYFCIPLLNEFHTTGISAIHSIGEDTFIKRFKLDRDELFVFFLKRYLIEELEVYVQLEKVSDQVLIAYMIQQIEDNGPTFKRSKVKQKNKITTDEHYQKAKEAKKIKDKELRLKLKENKPQSKPASFKGNVAYERSKDLKKLKDKELRQKLKESKPQRKSTIFKGNEAYEKSKELKRQRDKDLRDKNKARLSKYRKEQYQKMKDSRS
jgi:hypothetical protein